MNLLETFRIALRSLAANRLRSALTMLGIIIGVGSVMTMVAIGAGARAQIEERIRSLGANVLMVFPEADHQGGVGTGPSRGSITDDDALAIANDLASVSAAAPALLGKFQVVAGNLNWQTTIYGTKAPYFFVRDWGVAAGRIFSHSEERAGDKVAVLGRAVAERLFDDADRAVGRSVRILNSTFTVIGVLADKGASGLGRDQNDIVFVPLKTARQRLLGRANQVHRAGVDYVVVKAVSSEAMAQAKDEITRLLRRRHGVRAGAANDFTISDPAAAMAAHDASSRTLSWLLASIASVSLIVGGISIMNIMLVSVAERRREIGLRLALGARRREIMMQFLAEAFVLGLLGGAIGLVAGFGASVLLAGLAGWPVFLSPVSIAMALFLALGTGLFFGYYPARRAAMNDPIQCLRAG